MNEAKARLVRGKIRNETEFVAREYSVPLLRVKTPSSLSKPHPFAYRYARLLHNHSSEFPTPPTPRHTRVDACRTFRRCPAKPLSLL